MPTPGEGNATPRWVVIAHLIVEAETEEQTTARGQHELATRFPAADGRHRDGDGAARFTVIVTERLPDAADRPPRQPV